MPRRLAIAFAALAMLAAAPAHAMTDGDVCDDAGEETATTPASIASVPAPAATLAPAAPNAGLLDAADLCRGDRLTDDASCWPRSPAGAPHSGGFPGLGGPDVSLLVSSSLPGPETTRASLPMTPAGAEHPGYARGVDRPPRSF